MSEQIMVCAICGRVLDYYQALNPRSHSGYRHTYQDMQTQDHEAVPVPVEYAKATQFPSKAPRFRCDFCNIDTQTDSEWTVPATSFEMPMSIPYERRLFPVQMSEGDWAACDECAALINADAWDDLITRCSGGNPETSVMLMPLYKALRKNITGPPYKEKV